MDGTAGLQTRRSLLEIARSRVATRDASSKPDSYYRAYERYFDPLRDHPVTLFEIGVHKGESTRIFAEFFAAGRIVGIDRALGGLDLADLGNVTLAESDQADTERLTALAAQHAPDGIDIVIDDASHIGGMSMVTFQSLFPLVKPGGIYAIEAWGTGYWQDWPDGHAYRPLRREGDRFISHDDGMVGLAKHLVDHVAGLATRATTQEIPQEPGGLRGFARRLAGRRPNILTRPIRFEEVAALHVLPGLLLLEKRLPRP